MEININLIITIVLILGAFASIVACINTLTILKDLAEIKEKLDIKEEKKPSFLDKDLDNH
ncbi:hypothetical protein RRU94_16865 [Domibacillus sp. DTU_2020_1001157_1_SI_ALB_TIR_016]|uniref:hypothetical protein n=1 Tax=Domibacillus sp. DTU_2020_1001157_1_SI_ALB_TIR_016 TaxID=3077789 RepID=UPI0028E267C9|nr:hypothetical protein [Domibacillus sp. DTU_2020_1001157_1_SI_ALB_TIR_016]WNS79227.1 hypothetical protein RRU94_16865 [Domibacillus sp. DTU_2020_1001157_1_SI_ALB_TIR_016]